MSKNIEIGDLFIFSENFVDKEYFLCINKKNSMIKFYDFKRKLVFKCPEIVVKENINVIFFKTM